MKNVVKFLTFVLLTATLGLAQSQINSFQILRLGKQSTAPANPPINASYVYFDGTNVVCVTSSGASCLASGSGAAWGAITGTLSNQTDLQTALNLKSPLASPTFTGTPAAPTAAQGTNTTQLATMAALQTAIQGVNPAVAVQAATTAVLPNSPTYSNGASGIGATLTAGSAAALVVDGYTPVLNDRILVKTQASSFQNGVYFLSTLGTGIVPYVLTRSLDFNQPSDMNNTGAIPVLNGTVNAITQWVISSTVNTVGTDAVTFTQFSSNPATNSGAMVQLETHTASSSATLDFTTCISGSTYHIFRFQLTDVVPATANQTLAMRLGNGGTYDSGNNYAYQNFLVEGGASSPAANSAGTALFNIISNGQSNSATLPAVSGWIEIYDPLNTTRDKGFTSSLHYWDGANNLNASNTGTGTYLVQTAVNDVRFLFASGNIASGTITCYGITP